jgi:flagellar motor switch protein FliM
VEKILSQDEIDALFRATQSGQLSASAARMERRNVQSFDLRAIGQISKDQMRALSILHEGFARNITNSLGAYLRVGFDVNLVSVEQLNYSEALSRIPDLTYLNSIRVAPLDAAALLQMDLSVAFPIMDLMLGGPGSGTVEVRDLTEIEEQILESVVRILLRELQASWAPVLEVQFEFEQRQQSAQAVAMMPPSERTLVLSFEIKIPDAQGMLNVTLPAVASNALFRKLSEQTSYYRHVGSSEYAAQVRTRMLEMALPVELRLPSVPVSVRDLTELKTGDVLALNHPVEQSAVLLVSGKEMFCAYPVACGSFRGGQVLNKKSIVPASRRELQ